MNKLPDNLSIVDYYQSHLNTSEIKFNQSGWSKNLRCPFPSHTDKKPSFGFHRDSGCFKCFSCGESGNLVYFEKAINNHANIRDAYKELKKKYGATTNLLEEKIARYQRNLQNNKDNSLDAVQTMGISKKVALKNKLGYIPKRGKWEARLIFPIFDHRGSAVTLKKYSRNAPSKYKSMFEKGGKVSLYGIENFSRSKKVILCAGEKDKNVAESYLGDHYDVVTFTGGEKSLPKTEFLETALNYFKDREVIICYDCDHAGQEGTQKVAETIIKVVKSISILQWPETFITKYPKGDITDFFVNEQKTAQQFIELLENAKAFSNTNTQNQNVKKSGNVIESEYAYIKEKKDDAITISNFIVVPTERVWIDNREAVKVMLKSKRSTHHTTLERDAWLSKYNFIKEINSIDLSFRGSDADLQCIQEIVSSYEVPTRRGTRELGYDKQDHLFVLPKKIISQNDNNHPEIVFIPTQGQHPFQKMVKFPELPSESVKPFLQKVFKHLPNLHQQAPLSIALGWLFAVPFKPQIMQHLQHFPFINIFGTRGSGKTTLALLLWRLMGFSSGEIFSCSQSPFSMLKLLSSTNSLPIFIDEFKPNDMASSQVQRIHRLLRQLYVGEVEAKGRPDQTLLHYKLQAPTGVLGEVSFNEAALLERMLPVPLSFQKMEYKHRQARKELHALPLEAFASLYFKWVLQQNTQQILEEATQEVNAICEISSDRIVDNITVAIFGLKCMQKFAQSFDIEVEEFSKEELMQLCTEELCEVSGGKIAVDTLLENLAILAEEMTLVRGTHYLTEKYYDKNQPNYLYLRLEQCLPRFKEWAKRTCCDDEILDCKAYKRMLKERLNSYVVEVNKVKTMSNSAQRVVVIDLEKAQKFGLELHGFCCH